MDIYAGLLESMVNCCGRIGFRQGPVYTVAMMALGLGISLNILSIIDVLWTCGVLPDPYRSAAGLHPQRYLSALLSVVFIVNTILARLRFSVAHRRLQSSRFVTSAAAAPAYVLGSVCVFLITLP